MYNNNNNSNFHITLHSYLGAVIPQTGYQPGAGGKPGKVPGGKNSLFPSIVLLNDTLVTDQN